MIDTLKTGDNHDVPLLQFLLNGGSIHTQNARLLEGLVGQYPDLKTEK